MNFFDGFWKKLIFVAVSICIMGQAEIVCIAFVCEIKMQALLNGTKVKSSI